MNDIGGNLRSTLSIPSEEQFGVEAVQYWHWIIRAWLHGSLVHVWCMSGACLVDSG